MLSPPLPGRGYGDTPSTPHPLGYALAYLTKGFFVFCRLFFPNTLIPYLKAIHHPDEDDLFVEIGMFAKLGGDQNASMVVDGALHGPGIKIAQEGLSLFFELGEVLHLFLEYLPFRKGVGYQAAVQDGDDKLVPAVVPLQDLPELGRDADPSLSVYAVFESAPEPFFFSPLC